MWIPEALSPEGPRYLALADAIERDVARHRLLPGAQLPPQRELAERLGLDLTTVTRAYGEARRRGLIAGQVGRGTFVRTRPAASAAGGESGIIDLSLNLPPPATVKLAGSVLARTLERLRRHPDLASLLRYEQPPGSSLHREAAAGWVESRGVRTHPDQIVICSGAQHALVVTLTTLLEPGDRIACESLTYPGFSALAARLHLELVGVEMDEEGIVPEAFQRACRGGGIRALYCVPTAQNPTTATMSVERRRAIAAVAREHGVSIIEDDTYGALPANPLPPLSSFAPEQSYFAAGLAKILGPGLRIAYLHAPSTHHAECLATMLRLTTWMASPLTAEIAAGWIADGTAAMLLEKSREEVQRRQSLARRVLGATGPAPEAYHLWLPLPERWAITNFVLRARQHGVIVSGADGYAVPGTNPPRAVRLGLCAPEAEESLERALQTLATLLEAEPRAVMPGL